MIGDALLRRSLTNYETDLCTNLLSVLGVFVALAFGQKTTSRTPTQSPPLHALPSLEAGLAESF